MRAVVLLSDLLSRTRVKIPLESTSKEALLRELVEVLEGDRCVEDSESVLRVVQEREAVLSTGIGNGVAIPHGKSGACSRLSIAAGVSAEPVDFDALDDQPVRLVFLLVGPESAGGEHIKALSRIARLVRQPELRQRLIDASDSTQFLETLRAAEAG